MDTPLPIYFSITVDLDKPDRDLSEKYENGQYSTYQEQIRDGLHEIGADDVCFSHSNWAKFEIENSETLYQEVKEIHQQIVDIYKNYGVEI